MTNDFNDALFDAVLQKAFYDYEKEQISSYPDDEELSKMFPIPKREIRNLRLAVKEKKYGKSIVSVYLSRVAVIFLCIIALGTGIIMTSPTVRAAVRDVIIEWFDKYTSFNILNGSVTQNDFADINDVEIGYVPAGFVLTDSTDMGSILMNTYESSVNDDVYSIDIFENEGSTIFTDNEYSKYEKTTINSHEAWVIYSEENSTGTIILVGSKVSVSIYGILPKDELIKVAEKIKYKPFITKMSCDVEFSGTL